MFRHSFILFIVLCCLCTISFAQQPSFSVYQYKLPPEVSYLENQMSGLQIAHGNLYMLAESRVLDGQPSLLFSIRLTDLEKQLTDIAFVLPYKKINIVGLDKLVNQMKQEGNIYEGLEAIVIKNNTVYLAAETTTESVCSYIMKGRLKKDTVQLDTIATAVRKPVTSKGEEIYNASFEAITLYKKRLHLFFEYNYFDINYVYSYNKRLSPASRDSLLLNNRLPFRITDITPVGKNQFIGINFFFKGGGRDTIYRNIPSADTIIEKIKQGDKYQDFQRLITVTKHSDHFSWQPLWTFPPAYTSYNFEGIAAYKKGYFICNDKYTPSKPYASVLIYVHP